jgi:predicted ribosome quality control (RQC) complex YloA/Tae2 family protein
MAAGILKKKPEVDGLTYDGLTMSAVCRELKDTLDSARLERIYQPHNLELHLHLRVAGGQHLLVCSADAGLARIHLSGEKAAYPATPPAFCMLLRKHLTGTRLLAIAQQDLDRVLVLTFRSHDEAGNPARKHLVCEIMGKHSNLILVSENSAADWQILGSARIITPEMSRYRAVSPGEPYIPPPRQKKLSPAGISEEALARALAGQPDNKPEQLLVNAVAGLGPEVSRELLYRAAGDTATHPLEATRALTVELRALAETMEKGQFNPCIVVSPDGRPLAFAPVTLTRYPPEWISSFSAMNEALDTYYSLSLRRQKELALRQQLRQAAETALARAARKKDLQQKELEATEGAESFRLYGELLTAGLHGIRPGSKSADVINYYSDAQDTVSIPLDPALTPKENARRYFRKYRKLKDGAVLLIKRLQETRLEEQYLASLQPAIDNADLEALLEIRGEMEESGLIRKNIRRAREPEASSLPLRFASPDGISIFVGRNNRQNDYLTLKSAAPDDTWLHARDIPGAHVIVKSGDPPPETLLMAARLAALYSRAGGSDKVPVDYTLVRHVRKPRGARPGMVIYSHQRTVFVQPAETSKF